MPVRIRLSRIGKKKAPFYRIVVVDGRKKRDGEYLQDLGTYDALKTRLVRYDEPNIQKWISLGAQPSETVEKLMKLYKRNGIATSTPAPAATPVKASKVRRPVKVAEEQPTVTPPAE